MSCCLLSREGLWCASDQLFDTGVIDRRLEAFVIGERRVVACEIGCVEGPVIVSQGGM